MKSIASLLTRVKNPNYGSSSDSESFFAFQTFNLFALGLAVSLSVTFVIWDFKDKFRRRLLIYIPFMIIILCISLYNYAGGDVLILPDVQAVFNILLTFLVTVCLIQLWKMKTTSTDGMVLKYLIFFLLAFSGFCLPLFFNLIWVFALLGVPRALILTLNLPILSTIAGITSTVLTVLKYRDDKKKEIKITVSPD